MAIIASGDITANASGQIIATNAATGKGQDITLVAGALLTNTTGTNQTTGTVSGGAAATNATDGSATVNVTNLAQNGFPSGSDSGGSITLTGSKVTNVLDSSGTTGSAGNITLVAFSGNISTATESVLNAQAGTSGNGGNLTVIAPFGISIGGANTAGAAAAGTGGAITMATSQPTSSGTAKMSPLSQTDRLVPLMHLPTAT